MTPEPSPCGAVLELQHHDGTGIHRYECTRPTGHATTDGNAAIHWDDTSPMWRTTDHHTTDRIVRHLLTITHPVQPHHDDYAWDANPGWRAPDPAQRAALGQQLLGKAWQRIVENYCQRQQ